MHLSLTTCAQLANARTSMDKLFVLLGALEPNDWELFGRFAGKVRQARRKAKLKFEQMANDLQARRFVERRALWRASGKTVCRHGVFWRRRVLPACPCMLDDVEHVAWIDAVWMPALDHTLRCLVVTPFDAQYFRRLGILQAEARRLHW